MIRNLDTLQSVMYNAKNIRNISVIAHVDHGKSTLTDSLVCAAGVITMKNVGSRLFTHTRPDEMAKGITIKSTSLSLLFKDYLIHVIDSPGHVDFSSEVTAALRVTDGSLVVVDVVEGCRTQTETVLRQAMAEKIRPTLVINKIDRAIQELQYSPEELYQQLCKVIEGTNSIVSTYSDEEPIELNPAVGNVCFAAAKMGFGFTITKFAEMYSKKFGIPVNKLMSKLWGENYFDEETNKWSTSSTTASGKKLKRGFVKFILEPIYAIFNLLQDDAIPRVKLWASLDPILTKLGIKLSEADREGTCKEMLKTTMQQFLPCHEALLDMIVTHLPSPVEAQSYRVPLLYEGSLDDKYAQAIKSCDKNGPLMMFVSKMVPSADGSRFIAFGRVFSGTCVAGQKVRIMGSDYQVTTGHDLFHGSVNKTLVMMGKSSESVEEVPAGNVCGLVGIDKYLSKSGTLTEEENKDASPLKRMKYSVSPVVQVAVEPENPADIKKMMEGLKRLSKSDPLVQCFKSDTGQFVVAGAGELHLEICLNDLENEFCNGIKLKRSNPVVTFCETVVEKSEACLAKSANKLNRLFVQAEPMQESLVEAVEQGTIKCFDDPKALAKLLKDKFDWSLSDAKKIWCFGPDTGSNMFVDQTKSADYIHDIQDTVVSGFTWATKHGVLCEEAMRGVRFNLLDVMIHGDAAHRGSGQILPAARRAIYASQLSAEPRIVEPIYLVEIQTNQSVLGNVYNIINKRRGMVIGTEPVSGPIVNVKAHLPVLESFGLTETLRGATGGQAFPQCSFDHWKTLENQNPYDASTKAHEIVKSIRERKGLKIELPSLSEYLDKL